MSARDEARAKTAAAHEKVQKCHAALEQAIEEWKRALEEEVAVKRSIPSEGLIALLQSLLPSPRLIRVFKCGRPVAGRRLILQAAGAGLITSTHKSDNYVFVQITEKGEACLLKHTLSPQKGPSAWSVERYLHDGKPYRKCTRYVPFGGGPYLFVKVRRKPVISMANMSYRVVQVKSVWMFKVTLRLLRRGTCVPAGRVNGRRMLYVLFLLSTILISLLLALSSNPYIWCPATAVLLMQSYRLFRGSRVSVERDTGSLALAWEWSPEGSDKKL